MKPQEIESQLQEKGNGYVAHLRVFNDLTKDGDVVSPFGAVRIAVISSFTVDPLVPCLTVQAASRKISVDIYKTPYGQYHQEILNPNSNLYEFNPDLTFFWIDARSLLPELFDQPYQHSQTERCQWADKSLEELGSLLRNLRKLTKGLLIVANWIPPVATEMGILEGHQEPGVFAAIEDANHHLRKLVRNLTSTYVFDLAHLTLRFGLKHAVDTKLANYGDIRFSLDFFAQVAHEFLGYLLPAKGLIRKCLVLDLDDTLWGGTVGEDGWENIHIGNDTPEGRGYMQFQHIINRFFHRGIILAINSKNNEADVWEVFEKRPEIVLKREQFAATRINWNDKARNIREIADELNIGLESLIFFDNSPCERELVRELLPDVLVPDFPKTSDGLADCLLKLPDLNVLAITEEDRQKGEMYVKEKARFSARIQSTDLTSYFFSLKTIAKIDYAKQHQAVRLSQLSQKTNQFNCTTRRYTEMEIKSFMESNAYRLFSLSMHDKFGDFGIVGLCILARNNEISWRLDTFLLSCRAIGRQVEIAFFRQIVDFVLCEGAVELLLEFIPTDRNMVAKEFLECMGWQGISTVHNLQSHLICPEELRIKVPEWIEIIE